MCDEGRINGRHLRGCATRIIHLLLVVLFFAPASAAALAQSSTYWDMQNASNTVAIYPTPTVMPAEIPAFTSLSGIVLDAQGNKIPGAYVVLYQDGGTVPISDNPAYTGSDTGNGYGEYNFSGLKPGKYTVYAEKSDIFLYNGSASISLEGDVDTRLNVVIKSYAARPTPAQAPVPIFAAMSAPVATILPSNTTSADAVDGMMAKVKDKALGPMIGLFVIAIAGAGFMALRDVLKPKGKNAVPQNPSTVEKNAGAIENPVAAPVSKIDTGYAAEIKELAEMIASSGYGDIATLNRINAVSKKYGVDQNTIFTDIKKAKGGKR